MGTLGVSDVFPIVCRGGFPMRAISCDSPVSLETRLYREAYSCDPFAAAHL